MIAALDALEAALLENQQRAEQMRERMTEIRTAHARGLSWREIVSTGEGPLIVELLTESARALDAAGAQARRMEARALYDEGLTMDQIARLFGVSRQRISVLLRAHTQRLASAA